MQHCVGPEPKRVVLEGQVRGEAVVLSDQAENWCSEGHTDFDLQCGESLAIAVNRRIGEEVFGVKQLLRGLVRGIEITLACFVLLSSLSSGRPSKQSES